jgi:hypothetical protein
MTTGELVGHVTFSNVRHLPAQAFRWRIGPVVVNSDQDWMPPRMDDAELYPETILPIGAHMKMGSPGFWRSQIDNCKSDPKFVYVWGRATYKDGFGKGRFVNFCHRYNWANRVTPPGGGVRLDPEDARYHRHGNKAD